MPSWIRIKIPAAGPVLRIESTLRELTLHSVCESALCPNRGECFSKGTVTFMILGDICTRNCPFCAVKRGRPLPPDPWEPLRVAEAVERLGLKHVVITSVDRDDLPDFGAGHFAETVREIRAKRSGVSIEVLIPDFQGSRNSLDRVVKAGPDILNHNLETVPRLHPSVKPKSLYSRSLKLLRYVKEKAPGMCTKSGLMVGLGENRDEVVSVMKDLRAVGCGILTIGQYLQPPGSRLKVKEYVPPEVFEWYRKVAEEMGFTYVASSPLVRSSYNAAEAGLQILRVGR